MSVWLTNFKTKKKKNLVLCQQHSQQCRKINKVTRWIVSSPFLQEIVDTQRGYKIHVSEEALQRSSNRRGKTYKEVDLIVSILNEAFFRVSSSSDTKVHRIIVYLSLKALFYLCLIKCDCILFGQHMHVITLWFLLWTMCYRGADTGGKWLTWVKPSIAWAKCVGSLAWCERNSQPFSACSTQIHKHQSGKMLLHHTIIVKTHCGPCGFLLTCCLFSLL